MLVPALVLARWSAVVRLTKGSMHLDDSDGYIVQASFQRRIEREREREHHRDRHMGQFAPREGITGCHRGETGCRRYEQSSTVSKIVDFYMPCLCAYILSHGCVYHLKRKSSQLLAGTVRHI